MIRSLVGAAVIALLLPVSASGQPSPLSVYLQHSGSRTVGMRFAYEVREGLRNSALCPLTAVTIVFGQEITPQQIEQAIQSGLSTKNLTMPGCAADSETSGRLDGFNVILMGPLNRIALAANNAKRAYQKFSTADVTTEMSGATATVMLEPWAPRIQGGMIHAAPSAIMFIVIRSVPPKGQEPMVVRLDRFTTEDRRWMAPSGIPVEGKAMITTLPWVDLQNFPKGALQLIVGSQVGDYECKFTEKNRALVR